MLTPTTAAALLSLPAGQRVFPRGPALANLRQTVICEIGGRMVPTRDCTADLCRAVLLTAAKTQPGAFADTDARLEAYLRARAGQLTGNLPPPPAAPAPLVLVAETAKLSQPALF